MKSPILELKMDSDEILLAGTRVTGIELHLGTYLGWLKQIEEAEKQVKCLIMICDLQSLDCNSDKKKAYKLKQNIKKITPQIPVIIESEIENIGVLAFIISSFMNNNIANRISTFKKLSKVSPRIPLNIFLYPSYMLADLLSINATHMFNKPEGRFQHIDVINDLIKRINSSKKINIDTIKSWHKKPVEIPRLSGEGAMKREASLSSDVILVSDDINEIIRKLSPVKGDNSLNNRHTSCKVVFPILRSIQKFQMDNQLESDCLSYKITCDDCIKRLAILINEDVSRKRNHNYNADEIESNWKRIASDNVNRALEDYLNK